MSFVKHAQIRQQARKDAGLSRKQLARRIGRSVDTIRKYENNGVPYYLAVAWAHHCSCSLDVLL